MVTMSDIYKQRDRIGPAGDPAGDPVEDTVVLEPDWNAVAYGIEREAAKPLPVALRRVHASLYTLRAYKRWMLQIRETWNIDKR